MVRVLVTGASGQLGKSIKELQSAYPFEFIFTSAETLDIREAEQVDNFFRVQSPDYCINAAAYTAVDHAEADKMAAYEANVVGVNNLARACKQQTTALMHLSTDFVFDGNNCRPYREDDPTGPKSAYGNSKLQGERIALSENPRSLIIRTAWLYSPYGKNFLQTMKALGKKESEVRVVSDQIGTPTYARDLADVILQIILQRATERRPSEKIWGIYHYTNEGVASWYDFAHAIFEELDMPVPLIPVRTEDFPRAASRPAFSVLDKQKIRQVFDLQIPHWRDALRRCVQKMQD